MTAYALALEKKRDTILPYLAQELSPRGYLKEAIRDGDMESFTALLEQPESQGKINEQDPVCIFLCFSMIQHYNFI